MKPIKTKHGLILPGDCVTRMMFGTWDHVDLVFGSPPYEDARLYGELDFNLKGQDWVDWMVEVFQVSLKITDGLVAFVIGHGRTKNFKWSCTPALLCADLHRAGICVRDPKCFYRFGISGSGGNDDLRKDFEWIICATNGGKLPWSDPTAMGHAPKYKRGGERSNRRKDGSRENDEPRRQEKELEIANPGNVIKCNVGGGHMGSSIAGDNEAPMPETLANFFIRTFCPPGGTVYDPFGGSGTTAAVAIKTGRKFITSDIRESQIKLIEKRVKEASRTKGFGL